MHSGEEDDTESLDAEPKEDMEYRSLQTFVDIYPRFYHRRKATKKATYQRTQKPSREQQKVSGQDRLDQIGYDVRFFLQPSKEADKTMIAAAKKLFTKAKEMDDSIVIYPWFKSSKSSKVQETRLVAETMGAFKTYFHQANPCAAGGFLYMRVWLSHDKEYGLAMIRNQ
jgi:hypothetical protein